MKEAVEHSKITFENMLKQWHNLSDKQRNEIQNNIDYLNEQLTIPALVGRSEQLKAYTRWLRQNNHLNSAPYPPLVTQYLKSL